VHFGPEAGRKAHLLFSDNNGAANEIDCGSTIKFYKRGRRKQIGLTSGQREHQLIVRDGYLLAESARGTKFSIYGTMLLLGKLIFGCKYIMLMTAEQLDEVGYRHAHDWSPVFLPSFIVNFIPSANIVNLKRCILNASSRCF
jgi:hypothetical protein